MVDQFFIYIIKRRSKSGARITYYTGQTNNVLRRSKEHKSGHTKANRGYDILGIKIVGIVGSRSIAMLFEKELKKLTHKRKAEVYSDGKNINST